ncbi:MAG: DUF4286 family protein [Muribaculaceae bacterium]
MAKYILNTSFHITESAKFLFETWAKEIYIPKALNSGIFTDHTFTRLLVDVEPGTFSYAIHLLCDDIKKATRWHDTIAASLKNKLHYQSGKQVVFFTTYMEII